MALLNPPGTTEAGTLDQDSVCDVEVGATLMKELPVPWFFDLKVSPEVNQAIQQLYP